MSSEQTTNPVSVVVVMGVSGAGKSTVAAMLAGRLGWAYEDADWFHPPANIEKMHSGRPLTDEDRWPWLNAIAAWIDAVRRAGERRFSGRHLFPAFVFKKLAQIKGVESVGVFARVDRFQGGR